MNLSDVLLMEVPSAAMKAVVRNENIDSRLNSTEEMANAIADQNDQLGQNLAQQFRFAGSTAVNLNIAISGIAAEWDSKDFFKQKLREKFSDDVFGRGIRPELTKTPHVIQAYDQEDKIILAFSFLGAARRYLEDFEIVTRNAQVVEYVVIHFDPFAIEVRASTDNNIVFRDLVVGIMNLLPEEVVWDQATKLTEDQANSLAIHLGARLRSAKHKMLEGPYATKEVTAHTQIPDLESDEHYKQEFINHPMKKKTLIFDYTYSFDYMETVSYVITDQGLWIRSKSGEEVISHILSKIKEVRYPMEPTVNEELEVLDEISTDEAEIDMQVIPEAD